MLNLPARDADESGQRQEGGRRLPWTTRSTAQIARPIWRSWSWRWSRVSRLRASASRLAPVL